MKLLALAVLLAVLQTSAPVPRKAPDPSNRAAQNVKSNSNGNQSPAQQPQTIVQPISPKPDANASHSPAAENTQQPVVVRELPPVSVTKDWWDRIYICFTGILIAVGIFGVRAAYKTLKAIEAQNAHIEKSANAALLNAQAVINSERPWIIVLPEKSNNGYRFRAINSGRTPADVISYSAEAVCMNSVKELPTEPVYGVEHKLLPKMLTPKDDSELLTIENFVDAVDECRRAEDRTTFPPTGTKIPVFYFRVVYTSPLYSARTEGNDGLPPYETRMCFYYSLHTGEGMVICGNENYNRQT